MTRLTLCLFLLSFCAFPVFGQTSESQGPSVPAVSSVAERGAEAEETEFHRFRKEGFNAVYNLDYQTAKKDFTRMTELEPKKPAGYLYLATALWLEQLNKSRRLQTSIYNDDSFYAETEEPLDVKFDAEYRGLMKKAVALGEEKLKTAPKDVETLYFLGATHGALAAYEATVARSFMSALRNGNKSVDLHKKVLTLDPTFTDANLTVGMYNYVVGSLPLPVKILAAVGGFTGSKKRGLELLKKVTETGRYTRDDARVVLIALYKREKRIEDAHAQLQVLAEKYPANYLVRLEMADALVRLGKHDESFQAFAALLEDPKAAAVRDLIEYSYAEALFSQDRHKEAREHFSKVVALKNANKDLAAMSHLRLGQLYDVTAQRPEAVAEYKTVLTAKNVFDSHNQARQFIKTPYKAGAKSAASTEAD